MHFCIGGVHFFLSGPHPGNQKIFRSMSKVLVFITKILLLQPTVVFLETKRITFCSNGCYFDSKIVSFGIKGDDVDDGDKGDADDVISSMTETGGEETLADLD